MHRSLRLASVPGLLTGMLLTGVLGCGSSPTPRKAEAKPAPAAPKAELPKEGGTVGMSANAKSPEKTAVAKTDDKQVAKSDDKKNAKKSGRTDLSQLFQVPEIPKAFLVPKEENKPETASVGPRRNERPLMRLIGFAKVDDRQQALLEIKGDVIAAGMNDMVEGAELVSLDSNSVTFQFAGNRWETKLFEQPWLNEQKGTAGTSNIARSAPRPARSSSPRSSNSRSAFAAQARPTSATNYAQTAGPSVQATGGNIPGMAGISSDNGIPGMAGPGGAGGAGIPGVTNPSSGSTGAGGVPAGLPGASGAGPMAGPAAGPMAGAMPGGQSSGPGLGGMPAGPAGPAAGGLPMP